MGVDDIRRAVADLDLQAVGQAIGEQRTDAGSAALTTTKQAVGQAGVPVCEASLSDWKHYVAAARALNRPDALRSRAMEWRDGTIYAVEMPGEPHDAVVAAIEAAIFAATGTGDRHLISPSSSFVLDKRGVPLQADAGFGPHAQVLGAAPPLPLKWEEYRTLKVEVGVDRDWPELERRAEQWRHIPGVHYVLCVRASRDLGTRQLRLDEVVDGEWKSSRMPVTDITSGTSVLLDSRRLLGLAPHALVPAGFREPSIVIDMSKVAEKAMECCRK